MKSKFLSLLALVAVMFVTVEAVAEDADTTADVAAIEAMYAKWRTAVETGHIPGYLASLDDAIAMIPPGGPDVEGIAAYETFLGPVFTVASYRIEVVTPANIEVHGDWALARYRYVIHLTMKGEGEVAEGALTAPANDSKYFDVLKRQADGSWKTYIHTWNASPSD